MVYVFGVDLFYLVCVLIFGLIFGSFVNAAAYRIPRQESLMTRSHCTQCDAMITWYQNIPVLSYLFLRGKCAQCKTKISVRYPIVEIATALLIVLVFFGLFHFFDNLREGEWSTPYIAALVVAAVGYTIFFTCLSVLAVIDIDTMTLPRRIIYLSALIIGITQIIVAIIVPVSMVSALITAVVSSFVYGVLFFIIWFIRPQGMGFGDVRLAFVLGAASGFLGWEVALVSFFASFFLATPYAIIAHFFNKKSLTEDREPLEGSEHSRDSEHLRDIESSENPEALEDSGTSGDPGNPGEDHGESKEKRKSKPLPFGPWMVLGFVFAVVFGEYLVSLYIGLL